MQMTRRWLTGCVYKQNYWYIINCVSSVFTIMQPMEWVLIKRLIVHFLQSFWQTNQKREFFAYLQRDEGNGLARSSKDEITRKGRGGTEPRFTHSPASRRYIQVRARVGVQSCLLFVIFFLPQSNLLCLVIICWGLIYIIIFGRDSLEKEWWCWLFVFRAIMCLYRPQVFLYHQQSSAPNSYSYGYEPLHRGINGINERTNQEKMLVAELKNFQQVSFSAPLQCSTF